MMISAFTAAVTFHAAAFVMLLMLGRFSCRYDVHISLTLPIARCAYDITRLR